MALGLAVGTRGADHNRSGAYEADFSESQRPAPGRSLDPPLAAIETEDRAAVMDSLILCKFLRGVFGDFYAEAAEMLRVVTGVAYDSEELRTVARRVVNARKCLNQREGWTAREDTLPARLLTDSTTEEPSLSRPVLEAMVSAYYAERGWDIEGRVPPTLRQELSIAESCFG